jgi:hypothetical protein
MVAAFLLLPPIVAAGDSQTASERAPDAAPSSVDDRDAAEERQVQPEADNRSFRSGPPDTTPYTRPAVPEDYAPQGKPAIPPGVTVPVPNESPDGKNFGNPDCGAN